MGSSNLNCAISNFPINDGEKVIAIFLERQNDNFDCDTFYPWGNYKFISLPILVEMGDYSCPKGILDEGDYEAEEPGEIITFNEVDKAIYEEFRKRTFLYSKKEKKLITEKHEDTRDQWYCSMYHSDFNDIQLGFDHYFHPQYVSHPLRHKMPNSLQVMFINLKVYDYMISPFPSVKTIDDFFESLQTERASRFRHQLSSFTDGLISTIEYLHKQANLKREVEIKTHELYNLTYRLWEAQKIICPSNRLSPQGGWNNDLDKIRSFYSTMVEIYDERIAEINE